VPDHPCDGNAFCDWRTVIAGHRASMLTLSQMSELWWGCAEKTCFGQPSGSLLDETEYKNVK